MPRDDAPRASLNFAILCGSCGEQSQHDATARVELLAKSLRNRVILSGKVVAANCTGQATCGFLGQSPLVVNTAFDRARRHSFSEECTLYRPSPPLSPTTPPTISNTSAPPSQTNPPP